MRQLQVRESKMTNCVAQYFRCPTRYIKPEGPLKINDYGCLGINGSSYGDYANGLSNLELATLENAFRKTLSGTGESSPPFDLSKVVDSLRYEQYAEVSTEKSAVRSMIHRAYYAIRPLLPVTVRKHLQSIHLRRWQQRPFPHWPVDRTVDHLLEQSLLHTLRASGEERVPFIWFWPEGAPSCAIMTHDVETRVGRDFCGTLMDIDDSFGIRASFQVVPEERYEVPQDFLDSITSRGFGLGVQDLNHDGHLYRDRQLFMTRAAKINSYARQWGTQGFRAAILYRRQEWFDALEFSYDMSVPNVAHLDPQHGGCCTVMPYFVGRILELPVTMTQDYTLFHILNDYSIDLWKRQMELIMETNGLMSFIVHPDYVTEEREQSVYKALLSHLARLREEEGIWIATPDEVNIWWRQRAEMELIDDGNVLRIEGPGCERARIAYATESGGRAVFTVQNEFAGHNMQSNATDFLEP
jgi:hypothetical protein